MDLQYDPTEAIKHLKESDPQLAQVIKASPAFSLRPEPLHSPFISLAKSIIYQQLSGRAAGTIFQRFCDLYESDFPTPDDILTTSDERLRSAGVSANKIKSLRDLSEKTIDGTVPSLETLQEMSDTAIIDQLTKVRGIGVWTVQMMLMSRLGRPDILPVSDLGIQKGYQRMLGRGMQIDKSPQAIRDLEKEIINHAERWRPYRSVASWYLWRCVDLDKDFIIQDIAK